MPVLQSNRALLDRFRAGEPEALGAVSRKILRTLEKRLRDGLATRLDAAPIRADGQPESSSARSGNTGMVRNAVPTY
jgi:hypothetical protein